MRLRNLLIGLLMLGTVAVGPALASVNNPCDHINDTRCCKAHGEDTASCTFRCDPAAVNVHLVAEDEDAEIKHASATCGDRTAKCSGSHTCTGHAKHNFRGNGACSADIDEWWDSGYNLWCWSSPGSGRSLAPAGELDALDGVDLADDPFCDGSEGFEGPGGGFHADRCGIGAGDCAVGGNCVFPPVDIPGTGLSLVHVVLEKGVATARVCNDGACVPVVPDLTLLEDGSLRITVG